MAFFIAALISVGVVLLGGYLETWRLRVTRTEFRSESVPDAFDGYRIVLVGGLHLRRLSGWTENIQRNLVSLSPDILVLAGNVKPSHNADNQSVHRVLAEFLEPVRPPDGVIAVRGYRDRKGFWEELPSNSPITLLSNSHRTIERDGERIEFLGAETAHAGHLDRGINQVRLALSSTAPGSALRILVAQSADFLRAVQGLPIDLILAADNLHYQFRLPGWGVPRRDSKVPYSWGAGWTREGSVSLFMTLGIGVRWLPFRFFMRPEITLIELRKGGCE